MRMMQAGIERTFHKAFPFFETSIDLEGIFFSDSFIV
jgi:hypothetical protein